MDIYTAIKQVTEAKYRRGESKVKTLAGKVAKEYLGIDSLNTESGEKQNFVPASKVERALVEMYNLGRKEGYDLERKGD